MFKWQSNFEDSNERIRKRQCKGIDIALETGIAFGRLEAKSLEEFEEVYNRSKIGEFSVVKAMEEIGVKKAIE